MDNPDAVSLTKTRKRALYEMILEKGADALVYSFSEYLAKDESLSFTERCDYLVLFYEIVLEIEQEINN